MSVFIIALPLTLFLLFVAPIWLWRHYTKRQKGGAELSQNELQRLQQLTQDARKMRQRIQALEAILDAEHPQWRQP